MMAAETNLHETYAEDCVRAAGRTNDSEYRRMLLKQASHWLSKARSERFAASLGGAKRE
jgi:hypothetical protein